MNSQFIHKVGMMEATNELSQLFVCVVSFVYLTCLMEKNEVMPSK